MRKVVLKDRGQENPAILVREGEKNVRFGWERGAVPEVYRREAVKEFRGLLTVLLPVIGKNAVVWEPIIEPPSEQKGRSQGVKTAELAVTLAARLQDAGLDREWEVVCSHRGERSRAEMAAAGVRLCQIAVFLGKEHTNKTRIGVADITIAGKMVPHPMPVLIEIEEAPGGTKPKHVLGDALLAFVGDRVELVEGVGKEKQYRPLAWAGTEIWVGFHPREGSDVARTKSLETRLNEFVAGKRVENPDGIGRIRLFNMAPESLYAELLTQLELVLQQLAFRRPSEAGGQSDAV